MVRYFSMFTGVGGFELGIGDKGEAVGFSEIDKYANELLKIKFPNVTNYGDATKIDERQLPDFDLLVGGFPCQSFSIAGKRKGFDDTRGTLFFDIARILAYKKPRYLVLENVKGLLSHDGGRTFQTIIGVLADLGYFVEWQVLNSKNFGVPQNRERVFIIGHLGGQPRQKVFPVGQDSTKDDIANTQKSSSQDEVAETLTIWYAKNQHGNQYIPENGEEGGTIKIRRLTPLECERLQGFPDNWTKDFSDTQRYKMMGNAVTVNVVKYIIEKLWKE